MKILSRTLFISLLQAFAFCLGGLLVLLFIADLFSSLDEFIQNRSHTGLIFSYYTALVPGMVLLILPTAVLFATLHTLFTLNRTSQLTAMQACGISPLTIFAPFICVGFAATVFLYFLTLGPAGSSRARQNEIMAELKSAPGTRGVYHAQVYRNIGAHRTWYVETLSVPTGEASGIDAGEQAADGHDIIEIFSRTGKWDPAANMWTLHDVMIETFNPNGQIATREMYDTLPLPTWHDAPGEMVRALKKPDEMDLGQIHRFLRTATAGGIPTSPYRTQFYYLLVYPWAAMVLILFALPQAMRHGNRHVGAGVFNAIFLLLGFYFTWNLCIALGRGGRVPAFLSVLVPMLGFAGAAIYRLMQLTGYKVKARS